MIHRFCFIVVTCGLLLSQTVYAATSLSMPWIYETASQGTAQSLRQLRALRKGTIDITDRTGNTALCVAISGRNYRAYNILRQAGANVQHNCVSRLPRALIQNFNTGYTAWVKQISMAKAAETTASSGSQVAVMGDTGLSTGAKVAIGVGAVALIGGGIALAAGGGGGSGGNSGGDSGNAGEPDTPTPPAPDTGDDDTDLCANINCGDHGTCNPVNGSCICSDSYTGDLCEIAPAVDPWVSRDPETYKTEEFNKGNSLVAISDLVSDSFALDARYRLDKKRFAGIQLSSPLRIRSGKASFNLPIARDSVADTVYRDAFDVSLKSQAREYNFGVYYAHETDDFEWRYELGARINPDHMAHVKPDYRALFGLAWQY